MAEGVRKSNRIKSHVRTSYTEDDFDYELHYDFPSDISNILKANSKQKNNYSKRKSLPKRSKKVDKSSKLGQRDIKSSAKNDLCAFEDVIVNTSDGDSPAISLEDAQIICPVCKKIFNSEQVLEEHMIRHQNEDVSLNGCLVCETCNRICLNQSSYNKHMKLHSGGRKFKCDICGKAFKDSCSLKRHIKSHESERPFTCNLCFKSFRDNPTLIRHKKTHVDRPRMYQCLKCDKSFTDKHSLKRHERIHTGLRPFECTVCYKTFSETGSFKRHLKIHSGVRNFSCAVCKKSFIEKQSLIRHQKNVCGFGDTKMNENSIFSSINHDNCNSGLENSEVSHGSFGEGISNFFNENSITNDSFNTFNSALSTRLSKNFISGALVNNVKSSDANEKSETACNPKEAPSLHSLIQKDPHLYSSISEIVDSIDSYEKMLDLCGETGQEAIDAALTGEVNEVLSKEPLPMPDNLMCFECGELLVSGENFKGGSNCFQPSSYSSLKCRNCEDEDNNYGEPPVLTTEVPINVNSLYSLKGNQKENSCLEKADVSRNIFGTNESLEHLRERLKTQHGVFVLGGLIYDGSDNESDDVDQADVTNSYAARSRSHSTDSEIVKVVGRQSPLEEIFQKENSNVTTMDDNINNQSKPNGQSNFFSKKSPICFITNEEQQSMWTNVTPKMDYEVDDQSIPSVFPCHLCTKVFATSSFLCRHLDLHKNSPHKCMVCDKTFTNSQSLKRHMNTHTGEKPYTCLYCSRRFRDPSNFSKHKKLCSTTSVPSPEDTAFSTSSVSSSQSLDDSSVEENIGGAYVTDLKQKLTFTSHLTTSNTMSLFSGTIPKFSHDDDGEDDDDDDLPVSFSHPSAESNIPSENEDKSVKASVTSGPEDRTSGINKEDVQTGTTKVDMLSYCTVCGRPFESEIALEMHMKYHLGDPKVTCIECGKSFADQFGLKRHMRIHAGVRPHVCEYCGRGYCDNWSLRKHKSRGCMLLEVRVPIDFLHPCSNCTRVFSDIEYLDEHMKTHKGLLKFECDICQKKFSEAFNLKRHRRLHMAICPGCDREFKDIQTLNDHRVNDCPVNIPQSTTRGKEDGFPCPECGRVYSTKAYLERHKMFHSGLRPFICEICSKRFSEAFKLRRHLKVHNKAKSFNYQICGNILTDEASLKRHVTNSSCSVKEQQHQQEPVDYPCTLCDKIFTKSYLLARHMNVHSQIRPFACNECERTYKDISSLRRHQLVHQGIKSFVCTVCTKDFYYSDSLKRHMTGSCGKKPKSRRRKIRSQRRKRKKANNNINMKNNNTVGKGILNLDPTYTETTKNISLEPHNLLHIKTQIYRTHIPAKKVKIGHWSCHKRKQCWRCHLKFKTVSSLLKHSGIHCHEKPYHCPQCFIRWSRKFYLRVHLVTHKSDPYHRKKGTSNLTSTQPQTVKETKTVYHQSQCFSGHSQI